MTWRLLRHAGIVVAATAGLAISPPRDSQEDLRQAAAAGDARRIAQALQAGAAPNFVYAEVQQLRIAGSDSGRLASGGASVRGETFSTTPLSLAIAAKSVEAVRSLLDSRADPNSESACGLTPLYLAVSSGRQELVELLLGNGARDKLVRYSCFTTTPPKSKTALMLAIETGRQNIILRLLQGKADPNVADEDGTTPLMIAARQNDPATVQLLLLAGSRSFWRNAAGKAAYQLASALTPTRLLLEQAFNRDEPDLDKLQNAATIQKSLPVLLEIAKAVPGRDREWNGLLDRLRQAVQWLNGRKGWDGVPEDYKKSLTLAVYALEKARRNFSLPLLSAVVLDLELKRDDCKARGPDAAGRNVPFKVTTVAFPQDPSPGWFVRFKHALDFRSGEWARFSDPTQALRELPPGPYEMYIERPDQAVRSCTEKVQVTFAMDHFTFVIPAGDRRNCK